MPSLLLAETATSCSHAVTLTERGLNGKLFRYRESVNQKARGEVNINDDIILAVGVDTTVTFSKAYSLLVIHTPTEEKRFQLTPQ